MLKHPRDQTRFEPEGQSAATAGAPASRNPRAAAAFRGTCGRMPRMGSLPPSHRPRSNGQLQRQVSRLVRRKLGIRLRHAQQMRLRHQHNPDRLSQLASIERRPMAYHLVCPIRWTPFPYLRQTAEEPRQRAMSYVHVLAPVFPSWILSAGLTRLANDRWSRFVVAFLTSSMSSGQHGNVRPTRSMR